MKRLLMLIPLILLCCLGCQQGKEVAALDVEADIQAIKDAAAGCEAANNVSDVAAVISYFADDSTLIPTNEPAAIGKDAIQSWLQQFYDAYTPEEEYVVDNVEIIDSVAIARVAWSGIFTPKDGGEQIKSYGTMLWILKRQPDESWKIAYSIWNNETLVRPTSAE